MAASNEPQADVDSAAQDSDLEARAGAPGECADGSADSAPAPATGSDLVGPVATAVLTREGFDLLIADPSPAAADVVANTDFHALFVTDEATTACLDKYSEATSGLWQEESPRRRAAKPRQESTELSSPLLDRLEGKTPHTKVLFTLKKQVQADLYLRFKSYVGRMCDRLDLPPHDKRLVTAAGELHNLAKFRHPGHYPNGFQGMLRAATKSLQVLNEQPDIVRILRLMYGNLEQAGTSAASSEVLGANILTVVDLFCDTLYADEHLNRTTLYSIERELSSLVGKLFRKDVVSALTLELREDVARRAVDEKPNRVVIYSDRMDRIYPLQARLRNEDFRATTIDSAEAFVGICKRELPDMIVVRLHSSPGDVVKTLHYLLREGIDVSRIPAFLLVKASAVHRLTSLLELGIEDIIDLDGSLDVLVLKMKKVRTRLETATTPEEPTASHSGSRGTLSDMSLVDLLQALGPSQRTARVTVTPEEPESDPLLVYLAKGNITFAQLGELVGETAIYRAIGWENGTWAIEQVTEADLPEPNNELSNDSLLMEGCRLLDEGTRDGPPAGEADAEPDLDNLFTA
jgi:DNA-binding response OmpR family regulator